MSVATSLNVWTYWAGPMPAWIATCIESMRLACRRSTFTLLTPETVGEYLPHRSAACEARWRQLPPGVGTDAIRAWLLVSRGGLWIDADTVLIRDPAELFSSRHERHQFLYSCWKRLPRRVIAGYVYSPAGHPVARRWAAGVELALELAESIGWGEIGEQLITPALRMCPSATWEMSRKTFLPVDIDAEPARYFASIAARSVVTIDTMGFGLNYSWMMANRAADLTPEAVATGHLLIHDVLRGACHHAKQAG